MVGLLIKPVLFLRGTCTGVDGLNISSYCQIAIAISRRYCREDRFEEEKSKLEESEVWDEDNADGDDL